jgi:hypothetical protein
MITPTVTIIPTLELLVPGSTMIKFILALNKGETGLNYSISLTYTAISIAVGILLAETVLKFTVPGLSSLLSVQRYSGAFHQLHPDFIFQDDKIRKRKLLPKGCLSYIVLIAHSANGFRTDYVNRNRDLYLQIVGSRETIARSSVQCNTTTPVWEEAFIVPLLNTPSGKLNFSVELKDRSNLRFDRRIGTLFCTADTINEIFSVDGITIFAMNSLNDMKIFRGRYSLSGVKYGSLDLSFSFHYLVAVKKDA